MIRSGTIGGARPTIGEEGLRPVDAPAVGTAAAGKPTYDPRFLLRPWMVVVEGHSGITFYAPSRGSALAAAWHAYNGALDPVTFKAFMTMAKVTPGVAAERYGERILVGGREAFFVSEGHYVQFALPGATTFSNSHHLDVQPWTAPAAEDCEDA